jgi:hypothetical protein
MAHRRRLELLSMALLFLSVPRLAFALTFDEAYTGAILFLYGGIGFFGALSLLYFLGGFIVYLARLGQEYRQTGLYHMIHGVRIMFYVIVAIGVLKLIE